MQNSIIMGELRKSVNNRLGVAGYVNIFKTVGYRHNLWFIGFTTYPELSLSAHNINLLDISSYYYTYDAVNVIHEVKKQLLLDPKFTCNEQCDFIEPNKNIYLYLYQIIEGVTNENVDVSDYLTYFSPSNLIHKSKIEELSIDGKNEIFLDPKMKKKLDKIPWQNIVHFYGRASDFPKQIQMILNKEDNEEIYNNILYNIEDQNGISQATPFMIQILLELLKYKTNKKMILNICQIVWDDVQYYFSNHMGEIHAKSMNELLKKENLWTDYESEIKDEQLWEKYSKKGNLYDWNYYTMKVFYDYKKQIEYCTYSLDTDLKRIGLKLYQEMTKNPYKILLTQ